MAKEPSQFEMKKQFNLPENAVFLGWVIHHPENDEYVVTYTSNEYMANIGWGLSPEKAKKFKTLKKANSVISDLDIGPNSSPKCDTLQFKRLASFLQKPWLAA